jgi:hypothetical protein
MLSDGGMDSVRMPIFDGKYEFREAGAFDKSYLISIQRLATTEFQPIANSFIASLRRVNNLFELPPQLIFWSTVMTEVTIAARVQRGMNPHDSSKDNEDDHREIALNIYNEMTGDLEHADVMGFGSYHLNEMLGDAHRPALPHATQGIEATFAAMIMASYAALETLAADLWVIAINQKSELAKNWIKENPSKQLSGPTIAGYDFDIASRMGTILHETRRVTFESLSEIRKAYSHAFKGKLDESFEPLNELVKVEKTRHLFAHRGGLIDRKFKDEMADFEEYAGLTIGERLRLTGPVTRDHITACIRTGTNLLKFADQWIDAK